MSKRLSIEDVKEYLTKNCKNYILLSTEYVSSKDKLKILCDKGHKFSKNFNDLKRRPRCPYCSLKHKYTLDEVREYIENVGHELISNEYKNCKEKIKIKCDCGHIFDVTFDSFKNQDTRCSICNTGGNIKYNLEFARKLFDDNGCELLEDSYINCDIYMKYKCSCGTISKISLKEFQLGHRCYNCRNKKIADRLRKPFNEVIKLFSDDGCELLSTEEEYVNAKSLLKYRCSCGNIAFITETKFFSGQRCGECSDERRRNTNLKRFGFSNPNANDKVKAKVRKTLYENNNAPASKQQKYLCNLLQGELNYPIKSYSLDIVLPNKLYIEYDGGGHTHQILYGNMTEKEFFNNEKARAYSLMNSGWEEIRIISRKDKIPQDNMILQMIDYAKEYLNKGHHYIKFDIDESKVINSQGTFDYDFGELRRIYKKDLENQNNQILDEAI